MFCIWALIRDPIMMPPSLKVLFSITHFWLMNIRNRRWVVKLLSLFLCWVNLLEIDVLITNQVIMLGWQISFFWMRSLSWDYSDSLISTCSLGHLAKEFFLVDRKSSLLFHLLLYFCFWFCEAQLLIAKCCVICRTRLQHFSFEKALSNWACFLRLWLLIWFEKQAWFWDWRLSSRSNFWKSFQNNLLPSLNDLLWHTSKIQICLCDCERVSEAKYW